MTIWPCPLWQDILLARGRCHPKLLDQITKLTSTEYGKWGTLHWLCGWKKALCSSSAWAWIRWDETTSSRTVQHVENIYRLTKCGQGVWFHISEKGASENWPPSPPSAFREEYLFSNYFKDRHKLASCLSEHLLYVLILQHAVGSISSSSKFERSYEVIDGWMVCGFVTSPPCLWQSYF